MYFPFCRWVPAGKLWTGAKGGAPQTEHGPVLSDRGLLQMAQMSGGMGLIPYAKSVVRTGPPDWTRSGIEQLDQAEFHGTQHDEVTLFQGLAVPGQGNIVHRYETTTWGCQFQVELAELKHSMSPFDR